LAPPAPLEESASLKISRGGVHQSWQIDYDLLRYYYYS